MTPVNYTHFHTLRSIEFVLVSFWASWCSACEAQRKTLELLEKERPDIFIATVDVGENRYLAQQFHVNNVPDLLLIKRGEVIARINGIQPLVSIISQINKHLL
jgi:thioredoxin 1